jgi:hypothetical protein
MVFYVIKVMRVDDDYLFCFLSESANHCPFAEQRLTRKKWKMYFIDFKAVIFSCDQGV